MTEDPTPQPVDINHASLEELVAVPGIGPALAGRMIEMRPFTSFEDLVGRVPGIGPESLKPMQAYLSLEQEAPAPARRKTRKTAAERAGQVAEAAAPEPDAPEEAASITEIQTPLNGEMPTVVLPAALPEKEKALIPRLAVELQVPRLNSREESAPPPPPAEAPRPPADSRRAWESIAWAAGTGLLVFITAVAFTLGLLALINGSLAYVPASQYSALQSRIEVLSSKMETLQQESSSLRARMETLDTLNGRVSTVETEAARLEESLQAARQELDALQEDVSQVQKSNETFQRFLDGMRNLLGETTPSTTQP